MNLYDRPVLVGDIVQGEVSGNLYRVEPPVSGSASLSLVIVKRGPGSNKNVGDPQRLGLSALRWPSIHDLDDLDDEVRKNPNTTTQEHLSKENDMNSDSINRAIQAERDAEARTKIAPIYKRMSTLVARTKVNEAIVCEPDSETMDTQFYGREDDDSWHYGNGTSRLDDERVVTALVHIVGEGGKAYRLVREKKVK